MKFNLQRFGGKGSSTTIQSTYEPTQYELELQSLEVRYANDIMPNAMALNAKAKALLDAADTAMTTISAGIGSKAEEALESVE